jgi:hypothetical protein
MPAVPDGRWDNLTEGITRAPADAEEVVVPLGDICVAAGGEARLIALVAGASFPRWDVISTAGPRIVAGASSVEVTIADLWAASGVPPRIAAVGVIASTCMRSR